MYRKIINFRTYLKQEEKKKTKSVNKSEIKQNFIKLNQLKSAGFFFALIGNKPEWIY